jgi:hypothetical protein
MTWDILNIQGKRKTNTLCKADSDCSNGRVCARPEYNDTRQICCDNKVGAFSHYVCTSLPEGKQCGTDGENSHALCASGLCKNGVCAKQQHKLVVSIHITHHAGTFVCHAAQYNHVDTPPNACMTKSLDMNFDTWKRQYGFYSLEYRKPPSEYHPPLTPLSHGNWEHPDVVSIVVMRHPMDRLLAGDAMAENLYGKPPARTAQQWWDYANDDHYTNNYALRIFSQGDTTEVGLEKAKRLLNRMTYIMDQACLNENMAKLGQELGWDTTTLFRKFRILDLKRKNRSSARERIGNDTLYDYLVERNKNDIELYEWSKTKSLVVCGANGTATQSITLPQQLEMIIPDRLVPVNLPPNTAPQLTLAVAIGLVLVLCKFKVRGKRFKTSLKAT